MFCNITIISALRDQIAADDVRGLMYKLGVSRFYAIKSPPMICVARSTSLVSSRLYANYFAAADVHGPSFMFCGLSLLYAIYIAVVDVSWVDVQIDDGRLICIVTGALQCTMFKLQRFVRTHGL